MLNKRTIIGLAVLALLIGLLLFSPPSPGIRLPVLLAGFATAAYLIGARRLKQRFLGFLARYGTVFLAFLFLEAALFEVFPALEAEARHLTATVVGGILSIGGAESYVSGPIVGLENPSLAFDISVACLGGMLFWVYIGLVLATPGASSRQRLIGICAGLVIMFGFNIFRITLSIYLDRLIGVYVHNYFYLFNMVFVLLVWAGWLWTLKPSRPHLSGAKA